MKNAEKIAVARRSVFYLTLAVDIMLLITGFLLPPMGIIDPTAIQGASILFGFGVFAQIPSILESAKSFKVQSGNSTIEVTARDDEKKKK